jgi:hypothetical protein
MTATTGTTYKATSAVSSLYVALIVLRYTISYYSSRIKGVSRKLGDGIQPMAERTMTLLLHLIQSSSKTSTILEDAFLVVGTLASCMSLFMTPKYNG